MSGPLGPMGDNFGSPDQMSEIQFEQPEWLKQLAHCASA